MSLNFSDIQDNQNIQLNADNYSGLGNAGPPNGLPSNNYSQQDNLSKPLTLEEPVMETIKRDLMNVYQKMKYVFTKSDTGSHLDELRTNWDLWGPLIISLVVAFTVTIGSTANTEQLFTNIFLALWLGPLVISINCQLLGADMYEWLMSLIVYCSAPIMVFSIISLVLRLVFKSFLIDLILGAGAVFLTIRGTKGYFESLVENDKKTLMLYPVLLFYVFLATYIAMA